MCVPICNQQHKDLPVTPDDGLPMNLHAVLGMKGCLVDDSANMRALVRPTAAGSSLSRTMIELIVDMALCVLQISRQPKLWSRSEWADLPHTRDLLDRSPWHLGAARSLRPPKTNSPLRRGLRPALRSLAGAASTTCWPVPLV